MLLDPREHELAQDLADAGDRARSADPDARPNPNFAAALREELLASGKPAPRFGWARTVRRLVPVVAGLVLLVAGIAAGRNLYLAVGDHATPTPHPTATPKPTPHPTATATADSSASVSPSPSPTPEPSGDPAPVPVPVPTPVPTPVLGSLSLVATGCPGGVVLDWSMYGGTAAFNHYTTLRNLTADIPLAYPPQGGAVDPGGTYTTVLAKSSAVDIGADPGVTSYYRAMAFDAANNVIAASSVASAVAQSVGSLGALAVAAGDPGMTQLTWSIFGGPGGCFTWYKLVYSETNPDPSYLGGDSYLAAVGNQAVGSYVSAALVSGHTYYLRVQVIRATDLGAFIVAQTDVATYLVP